MPRRLCESRIRDDLCTRSGCAPAVALRARDNSRARHSPRAFTGRAEGWVLSGPAQSARPSVIESRWPPTVAPNTEYAAKRLRGLQIDGRLEAQGLLDWEVGVAGSAENPVDVGCGAAARVLTVRPAALSRPTSASSARLV